jgi:hypothetical protein
LPSDARANDRDAAIPDLQLMRMIHGVDSL